MEDTQRYIQTLGQAVYNFSRFEWATIWLIATLNPRYFDTFDRVGKAESDVEIQRDLASAVAGAGSLNPTLRAELDEYTKMVDDLRGERYRLLTGHPFTDADGSQRVGGTSEGQLKIWTLDGLTTIASRFQHAEGLGQALRAKVLTAQKTTDPA